MHAGPYGCSGVLHTHHFESGKQYCVHVYISDITSSVNPKTLKGKKNIYKHYV